MLVFHRDAATHSLGFSSQSHYSVGALLHKRIQDVLGSGQIFWNNGPTHSCTHPASLCVPLSPFQAHMHAQCRQQNFDLLWKWFSPDYLPASHSLENCSKFDIYLNGRFLMKISRRSSIFVHCSGLFDISLPRTWYQPLCSTSIIVVRANVVDGASRCWKGRIRRRFEWSVGNQRRGAGHRRERVEMRFLRH